MNEKLRILIPISLKFVPKGSIDIKSALVQVMAWRWTSDKPLPEPMLDEFTDAYMRHCGGGYHITLFCCRGQQWFGEQMINVKKHDGIVTTTITEFRF